MMGILRGFFIGIASVLGFIQKYFKSLLFLFIVIVAILIFSGEQPKNNLLEIDLKGLIMSSEAFLEDLQKAYDSSIKGVLLNVDSPGGAVAPSIEIALAIKRLSKEKPVVAYASNTMASGSYYASIWADKIIANPGANVGSIGVYYEGFDISKLMDTIGVKSQTLQAGKYKLSGTYLREWNSYERDEIKQLIDDTYSLFIEDVANARGLDVNNSSVFADGKIFIAQKALDVKLIDMVGSKHDAKVEVIRLSKVKNPIWNRHSKSEGVLDRLISKTASSLISSLSGLQAY